MAAGDVTVGFNVEGFNAFHERAVVGGTVQLDGGNPTPIALSAYFDDIDFAMVTLVGDASAPGDDPVMVDHAISGTTINVYAWKHNGTDPTLIASTDNTHSVSFLAVGSRTRR